MVTHLTTAAHFTDPTISALQTVLAVVTSNTPLAIYTVVTVLAVRAINTFEIIHSQFLVG